ncbi:Cellulose synthase catalytic subunit [UDP-forming] [Jannaschia seosinensis]|uniref:Cellulose synthase catalytic subunit [UDP-forming] n=1 Tax=Jannaschia seosinensis TaxID=313367 RepID=A0A0M7BFD4_9RHOB|nr:glycosyltransferase family 2 protein [Jannaschia seosinensis]CUH41101.1 Cellulose synthase catalytic subunit [UDP-forming] [Jannaschia seosinensis]
MASIPSRSNAVPAEPVRPRRPVLPDRADPSRVLDFPKRPKRLVQAPEAAPAPAQVPAGPGFRRRPYVRRPKLGQVLLEMGAITASDLARALVLQRRLSARLGDVLVRRGMVTESTLAEALGQQRGMGLAGPAPRGSATDDAMARRMPVSMAMTYRALPWRRVGGRPLIATSRPEMIDDLRETLPPEFRDALFAVVTDAAIEARLHEIHGQSLAREAESRVPDAISCRRWRSRTGAAALALLVMAIAATALLWPVSTLRVATAVGLLVMAANLGLRIAAALAMRRRPYGFRSGRPSEEVDRKLPCVSILVPLHREPEIAGPLTERLSRIDYPRELLDICLVVEEDDTQTLDALAASELPRWMRVIPVPDGQPRTKPRAMNYALNFTRGAIVGIYDAEDAPAPDQILAVTRRFQTAPEDVVCLQGRLDYYNPTRNWMSRCFTIEYANWFRLVLPGIARLGLVVPLGGTTLFFRREALEEVGGWDAHNVTEDADLGVRLARRGYRTEIIETTTLEEANASPGAWIKQRSRWVKGYIMTWAVHSRRPIRLWRDLGTRRFFGFHLLFLGSVLSPLLIPVLWSMAIIPFGIHHPILDWLPGRGPMWLGVLVLSATAISMTVTAIGCSAAHHRRLRRWIPTLELYFPLATLAVLKALLELVARPFHWDKTTHGAFGGTDGAGISSLEKLLAAADDNPSLRSSHPA